MKHLESFDFNLITAIGGGEMESLFLKLFRYRERKDRSPEEDFMTELLAYILKNHTEVLLSLLIEFNVIESNLDISNLYVDTQYTIKDKENGYGSRPDIIIKFKDYNKNQYFILIENKIDSKEGTNQLSRYFSFLEEQSKNGKIATLIYLTKNYDSKEFNEDMLEGPYNQVKFIQIRWWQLYQILKKYQEVEIIGETLKFMKERGLSMSRRFSIMDINALMSINRIKEMLLESLSGPVEDKYNLVTGTKYSITSADSELRNTGRYIYMSNQKEWFWIGIGYWIGGKLINEGYPDLRVIVGIKPYHEERENVINAFKEFSYSNKLWPNFGLEYEQNWGGIWRKISLKEFVSGDDHIEEIQQWFLEGLKDIEEFKNIYPQLPWKTK